MEFIIPRKIKPKLLHKQRHHSDTIPKSIYHYTVFILKIFKNRKNQEDLVLLPLKKLLQQLIIRGKITSHGKNCLVSSNPTYLKAYFLQHKEKLIIISNKNYRYLAQIYYRIRNLSLE
jgi:hypothetical protein